MKRSDELYAAQKAFRRGCKSTHTRTLKSIKLQNWKIDGTAEKRIDDFIAKEIAMQLDRENGGDE